MEYEQYILDVLAELCGRQVGAELTFTLKEAGEDTAVE